VGSSILASLSEAGGNDQHSSWSKPLPPRSRTCVSRLPECVHDFGYCTPCANRATARLHKIPLFLFTFRLSTLRFHSFPNDKNPVSGGRSPASGIASLMPTHFPRLLSVDDRNQKYRSSHGAAYPAAPPLRARACGRSPFWKDEVPQESPAAPSMREFHDDFCLDQQKRHSARGFATPLKSCLLGPLKLFVNTSTHFEPRAVASFRFRLTETTGEAKLTRKYTIASQVQGFDRYRGTHGLNDSINRQHNREFFPALANLEQLRASAGLASYYRSSTYKVLSFSSGVINGFDFCPASSTCRKPGCGFGPLHGP
jgi:hypothetical protein